MGRVEGDERRCDCRGIALKKEKRKKEERGLVILEQKISGVEGEQPVLALGRGPGTDWNEFCFFFSLGGEDGVMGQGWWKFSATVPAAATPVPVVGAASSATAGT